MNRIGDDGLWIGHAGDARDLGRLAAEGIQALVILAAEGSCHWPPRDLVSLVSHSSTAAATLRPCSAWPEAAYAG